MGSECSVLAIVFQRAAVSHYLPLIPVFYHYLPKQVKQKIARKVIQADSSGPLRRNALRRALSLAAKEPRQFTILSARGSVEQVKFPCASPAPGIPELLVRRRRLA